MQKEILGFKSICHKLKGIKDMKKSEKWTKPKKFVYKDIEDINLNEKCLKT